ncbi:anthranilate phosphoribosyltransferase [Facilibium subflavum]|uniref:anthranilate phosphoribosyltransferase n=1 Tax=Facilibium subflavum TaxID=2219058 RepID=UPI000E65DF15|nr:anthranilate phosphoribosyltransferase [Facilibium subflavum]
MDIEVSIQTLLTDDIDIDAQYAIIEQVNKRVLEKETLYMLAKTFLQYSLKVENPFENTLDIVGTGGDGLQTLNYSTLSALVVHHLGGKIAKHGNRSATSRCGSFDFLQQLNFEIPETPEAAYSQLKQTGFTCLFAPYFHPVFAKVAEVRKRFAEEGKRTFFNILGPLLNPARVKRILVGVYDEALLSPFAYALENLGASHAYIVFGDGMDEFSVCGINKVIQIHQGTRNEFTLHPEQLGFMRSKVEYLNAGDAFCNVNESKAILTNELLGPKQDTLILNAAAALHISRGFEGTLLEMVEEIKTNLTNNAFADLLQREG